MLYRMTKRRDKVKFREKCVMLFLLMIACLPFAFAGKNGMVLLDSDSMQRNLAASHKIDVKGFEGPFAWDACFENEKGNELCMRSIPRGSFYYEELLDGSIKWGFDVPGHGNNPVFIEFSESPELLDFDIDYSDFDLAGLEYEFYGNFVKVLNPWVTDGWLDPTIKTSTLSTATQYNGQRKIVITSLSEIYVLSRNNTGECVLSNSTDGVSFTNTFLDLRSDFTCVSGSMVIDSDDILHIVIEDSQSSGDTYDDIVYVQWNTSDDTLIGNITVIDATTANDEATQADIALLDNGTIGIMYTRKDGGVPRIDIRTRHCDANCLNTGNWSAETTVFDGSAMGGVIAQRPDIDVNGTDWFATWYSKNGTYPSNFQIWYSHSSDGTTWDNNEVIDADNDIQYTNPNLIVKNNIPMIVADKIRAAPSTANRSIVFSQRNGSWGAWTTIYNGGDSSIQQIPSLSTDGTTLFAIWDATNISGTGVECVGYSNSTDNGTSWSNTSCLLGSEQGNATLIIDYPGLIYQYGKMVANWAIYSLFVMEDTENLYNVTFQQVAIASNPTFSVTDTTAFNNTNLLEMTFPNTNYSLSLDWNASLGNASDTFAYLVWNGTRYDVNASNLTYFEVGAFRLPRNLTGGATFTVTHYWWYNYTFNGTVFQVNTSVNTQNISRMVIENCTAGNRWVNFSIKDELTENVIGNNTFKAIFKVWNVSTSYDQNYTFTIQNKTFYSFCYLPSFAGLATDVVIEYTAPAYSTNFYYLNDYDITNATNNINLFLINSTAATAVDVLVRDEDDRPVTDAFIEIQTYDVGTNTYTTIGIQKTDSVNGLIVANLILLTQQYRFTVTAADGTTVLGTFGPMLVTDTQVILRVVVGADNFETWVSVNGITGNVYYTNATNSFTFDYTDTNSPTIVDFGFLNVVLRTGRGDRRICLNSTQSSGATLVCPLPANTSGRFIAIGYVNITTDGSLATIDQDEHIISQTLSIYGFMGAFLALLMMLTLAFTGGWSPAVVVTLMLIGMVACAFIGIWQISTGMAITLIIIGLLIIFMSKS